MEFLLFFLLPATLIVYVVGLLVWVVIYLIKYIDYWSRATRQEAAQRLLQAPIWPIIVLGMLRKFTKELKETAKEEEK